MGLAATSVTGYIILINVLIVIYFSVTAINWTVTNK